jgi:hypothetical protein
MAGARHGRESLVPGGAIRSFVRIRANPPSPGEMECSFKSARSSPLSRLSGVRLLYASRMKSLLDPPRSISAPLERGRARGGEGAVVDIAKRSDTFHELVD